MNKRFPLDNNSIDVITSSHSIEHVTDTDNYISEIKRVLKPNGYAVFSTDNLASWMDIFFLILGKQPKSNGIVNKDQRSPSVSQPLDTGIKIVADNLKTPWELAFLKDNEILVTERPGTLILIKQGQKIPISGVKASGEGGLLGLAIHPNF